MEWEEELKIGKVIDRFAVSSCWLTAQSIALCVREKRDRTHKIPSLFSFRTHTQSVSQSNAAQITHSKAVFALFLSSLPLSARPQHRIASLRHPQNANNRKMQLFFSQPTMIRE